MSKAHLSQAARATTSSAPQTKPKGNRPTHRISRVITDTAGNKTFQEVGALWPHRDGKGFSLKLRSPLNPTDNLSIRTNDVGGAS